MKYTFSNGLSVSYEIIRKNNKNIYFRFKDDLKLYISAPMYISQKEIEKLIFKNEESLLKMYDKVKDKVLEDDMIYYLGNKYLIVIDENALDVTIKDDKIIASKRSDIDAFMNKEMLKIFTREVEYAKKCFQKLPDFTLKTRKMTTRWGVNNVKKKIITLNTELIKKDIEAIDYVIIHELCHFYEPNHSRNFWQLVSLACPNYKEIRKSLR